jgi:hypothetical protein
MLLSLTAADTGAQLKMPNQADMKPTQPTEVFVQRFVTDSGHQFVTLMTPNGPLTGREMLESQLRQFNTKSGHDRT